MISTWLSVVLFFRGGGFGLPWHISGFGDHVVCMEVVPAHLAVDVPSLAKKEEVKKKKELPSSSKLPRQKDPFCQLGGVTSFHFVAFLRWGRVSRRASVGNLFVVDISDTSETSSFYPSLSPHYVCA